MLGGRNKAMWLHFKMPLRPLEKRPSESCVRFVAK